MTRVAEEGHKESFFDGIADETAVTPEDVILSDEVEARADAFVCGFIDMIGEDDFLVAVVQEILDGARKPAEIAKALNVPADEVYKARKCLQRQLDDYRAARLDEEEVGHG